MKLTTSQKRIKDRRDNVQVSYNNLASETPVSLIVKALSEKHKCSEVTIWSDLKFLGLSNGKERQAV